MMLFLDTEYTGFGQPNPKLISLALVAEDGHREFYIELIDTWEVEDCTEFVLKKVLPLLGGPQCTYLQGRAELRTWLDEAPRSVQAACDSAIDFRFLLDLIGAPSVPNLAASYFDLRPLIDSPVYDSAVASHHQIDPREHHALVDARAYRLGWLAWMDSRKATRVR
jgi:hypothetical protein